MLTVLALLLAAAPTDAPSPPPAPMIVGGWSAMPTAAPELRPVLRAGAARIGKRHGALRRVVSAGRQVVAGVNYRGTVMMGGRSRWRVTAWKQLDGKLTVTEVERLRAGQ